MTHAPRPRILYTAPESDEGYTFTRVGATCRDCQEPLIAVRSGRLSIPGTIHWRHRPAPDRGTRLQPPVFDVLGGKR